MVVISPSALQAPALIEPQAAVTPVALPLDQKAANVFDYALPLQPSHKSIAEYAPSLKAKLLANPATAADQMLRSLESFHKDMMAMRQPAAPDEAAPAPAQPQSAAGTMPGPAAQHPGRDSVIDGMRQVVTEMGEQARRTFAMTMRSQLVATVSQQVPTTVNTLIRS